MKKLILILTLLTANAFATDYVSYHDLKLGKCLRKTVKNWRKMDYRHVLETLDLFHDLIKGNVKKEKVEVCQLKLNKTKKRKDGIFTNLSKNEAKNELLRFLRKYEGVKVGAYPFAELVFAKRSHVVCKQAELNVALSFFAGVQVGAGGVICRRLDGAKFLGPSITLGAGINTFNISAGVSAGEYCAHCPGNGKNTRVIDVRSFKENRGQFLLIMAPSYVINNENNVDIPVNKIEKLEEGVGFYGLGLARNVFKSYDEEDKTDFHKIKASVRLIPLGHDNVYYVERMREVFAGLLDDGILRE
jgi:hypothetical protein